MNADCASVRPLLGELALGGLEPDREVGVRAHLDGCPECRAELRQLEGISRLLPLADPARLGSVERVPAGVAQSLFAQVASERRRSRTRRLAAGALVPLAAAAAIAGFVVLGGTDAPSGGAQVALEGAQVDGSAELVERDWGTAVRLEVAGLADGEQHAVWLLLDDGSRVPAGTFTGGGAQELAVGLAAAADTDAVALVGIDDADGSEVVRAEFDS